MLSPTINFYPSTTTRLRICRSMDLLKENLCDCSKHISIDVCRGSQPPFWRRREKSRYRMPWEIPWSRSRIKLCYFRPKSQLLPFEVEFRNVRSERLWICYWYLISPHSRLYLDISNLWLFIEELTRVCKSSPLFKMPYWKRGSLKIKLPSDATR